MSTGILLEAGTNELEIVEFYIDEQDYRGYYGVNVAKVLEIIRRQPVTAIPLMHHPSLLGAFLHRGETVIPLLDLGKYLDKETVITDAAKVIITEFNNIMIGFLISGVNRIHRVNWAQVEDPGTFLHNKSKFSVTGIIRLEERVIFLLDLESIVADIDPSVAIRFSVNLATPSPEDKKRIVLHADDSASIRNLVKKLLEESGIFEVIQVNSGQEAWDFIVNTLKEADLEGVKITDKIDALITDIEMPQMDGLTLCRKIKEDPNLQKLPVALFSSLITDRLAHKGESVGADIQFAKPDLLNLSEKLYHLISGYSLIKTDIE